MRRLCTANEIFREGEPAWVVSRERAAGLEPSVDRYKLPGAEVMSPREEECPMGVNVCRVAKGVVLVKWQCDALIVA
jgi:hypothetical protein